MAAVHVIADEDGQRRNFNGTISRYAEVPFGPDTVMVTMIVYPIIPQEILSMGVDAIGPWLTEEFGKVSADSIAVVGRARPEPP